MNEKHQTLTANLWLTMGWNDSYLRWNDSEWRGITALTVPDSYVWKPDIVLYENVDQHFKGWSKSETYVKLHHSGYVLWEIPTVTLSSCQVNVSSFPFDRQKCPLKFGPWIHSSYEVEMRSMAEKGSLKTFMINAEWHVLSFAAHTHIRSYGEAFDIGTPYSDVTFVLEFQRKSTFYVFNLLLPCLLLTFLMSTMFCLPMETGEKLSFGVSILLAIVVFQLVLNEVLPESEELPWIGRYVILAMIMMSVSLSLSVMVMSVCDCSITVRPMPGWVRTLFLKLLPRIMFMGNLYNGTGQPSKLPTDETGTFQMDLNIVSDPPEPYTTPLDHNDRSEYQAGWKVLAVNLRSIERKHSFFISYMKELDRKEEVRKEWRTLAKVLDRLFFLIYIITSTLCLAAFVAYV
ncbi:neuronal acetylcholine receptor subunit alpha-10-like [Branchiostoma floridae]|uniref:Neuronal acetylcholine receptor subunit alpha-10-like n=1 Tax=Branchiostoma floridae TaxID=7739 RepID=A0A9J7M5Y2_BRAFL|nr:neuronal acetylcholine receptor subunit alpha-10-like [Branchiostoma floridae]